MKDTGLTKEDIESIRAVLSKYHQIEKVLIYGSRAMGNYKPASDIDLTLFGNNIDLSLQTQIEFELDDLLLPYKFDVSVYERISNPEFIDHINRVGKVFYQRSNST